VSTSQPLLVVDLDDTLLDTSHVYWLSRSKFVEALVARGVENSRAIDLFEHQDAQNMLKMGFDPSRYAKSMRDVYEQLVSAGEIADEQAFARDLALYGDIVLQQLPELIEGAKELLAWARDKFKLVLLTRGHDPLQRRKIANSGLGSFFIDVRVVATKGASEFEDVLRAHGTDAANTWVIGDSIRSDINPALQIGANAILFAYTHHSYYWRQEYGVSPAGSFYKVDRLIDAIDLLRFPDRHTKISPESWIQTLASSPHPGSA
jgi:putative hydrolase of the HAD superfamily